MTMTAIDEAERVHARDENQSAFIHTAYFGGENEAGSGGMNAGRVELTKDVLVEKLSSCAEIPISAKMMVSVLSGCRRR